MQSTASPLAGSPELQLLHPTPLIPVVAPGAEQMTRDESIVLSYYIHCYVPLISVANCTSNFLTSAYLPLAFRCNAVRDALVATAAAHLYQAATDTTRQSELLDLVSTCRSRCQRFINDRISLSGHVQRDMLECIAVMLMLVGLEVQNGAFTPAWVNHLRCIRTSIRRHGGEGSFSRSSWEAGCIYRHFLYHDVMDFIMSGIISEDQYYEDDLLYGDETSAVAAESAVPPWAKYLSTETSSTNPHTLSVETIGSRETIHPLLGLSGNLFRLIQKIRRLPQFDCGTVDPFHIGLFHQLEREILAHQPDFTSLHNTPNLDGATNLDLHTLAEINRQVALILLYRRSTAYALRIPEMAQNLLCLAERIPLGSSTEAGLTYALFLAGAYLSLPEDTLRCSVRLYFIRQRLKVMNLSSVEEVLEEVWREKRSGNGNWDWEHVLRKRQWVINLA